MLPSKVLSLLAKPKQTVRFELTTSRTADTSHSTRFTVLLMSQTRITLNRGPAGWRPCCQMKNMNYPRGGELHRRAGRQSALQDCPVGCTLRWAGGLLIKLGYRNGRSGGLLFSEPTPPYSQPARSPFCAARRPALLSCLLCSPPTVHVFHSETRPSSPPGPQALQLVLSRKFSIISGQSWVQFEGQNSPSRPFAMMIK